MNRSLEHTITTELHHLIDESCQGNEDYSADYESFHRALIKKYFEAETVIIDKENHAVTLEIITNHDSTESKVVTVDVDFTKFAAFLKSCIDKHPSSIRFYQNMLRYYYAVSPISA